MNIALITNKKLHHKFWISELYKNNEISLIIHPMSKRSSLMNKIKAKKPFYYGSIHFLSKLFSYIYGKLHPDGLYRSIAKAEKKYFFNYEQEYKKIPSKKIIEVETVNSIDTINLLKDHNIDIVCFLGGEIVKKVFFKSFNFCINFHNGISPFYNGNKTNFHTVSDFRPNFSGGTLMKMNEKIDGGEILYHYLCPINKDDTASDLYMKGIIGSVKLYNKFLNKIDLKIKGVRQKKSFKYVRNIDWVLTNDFKLKKFYKSNQMKKFERGEKIIDYSNQNLSINDLYKISLSEILN